MKIEKLIEIAQNLEFKDLLQELQVIKSHEDSATCPLVLPLVGEFSSGKTTLINALTDNKKLETATKPTTATIFEIHFGCTNCTAKVVYPDGSEKVVDDIADLKNSELADSAVVEVYDTSTKVPATTILVDTPGLSSPDPRHKQTLVDFLPLADAILMVADINQQITRSMTDFVKDMELAKRQIFLVLTKSDTKAKNELQAVKEYIGENIKLPLEQICCVSAKNDDLQELISLFTRIDSKKKEILKQVNQHRVDTIRKEMVKRIDEIISSASSNEETEETLRKNQRELDKLNRSIDRLVRNAADYIEEIQRDTTRCFEDNVFSSLDTLVASKCDNFDARAVSTINNTCSLLQSEYKNNIHRKMAQLAEKQKGDEDIDLRCLSDMDLSSYEINGISYNLNLDELGHQYDNAIATGTKIAAVTAAVVATAGAAGAAVGSSAASAAAEVIAGSKVIDMIDTASDIGSIISNKKTAQRVEKAMSMAGKINDNMDTVNEYEQKYSQQIGSKKGLVASMVGFITERTMAKPQRRRAIREYLDSILIPEFKNKLNNLSQQIIGEIQNTLKQEAAVTFESITSSIQELKQLKATEDNQFRERIALLRSYKNEITTNK